MDSKQSQTTIGCVKVFLSMAHIMEATRIDPSGTPSFDSASFEDVELDSHFVNSNDWHDVLLPAAIGLPLRVRFVTKTAPGFSVLSLLSININPSDPEFGRPTLDGRGQVYIARTDGEALFGYQVKVLCQYITKHCSKMMGFAASNPTGSHPLNSPEATSAARALNPKRFIKFFANEKATMASSGKVCEGMVCPIEVVDPTHVCDGCGAQKEGGDTALLTCGGCHKAYYCDKICQKADRQTHKPLCKR